MGAMGAGIDDMRTHQSNRALGRAAVERRDLLTRRAARVEAEIATRPLHLGCLRRKVMPWNARDRSDVAAEVEASEHIEEMVSRLQEVVR